MEMTGDLNIIFDAPIRIPTPGKDALWSQLRQSWKALGINDMPFRQRQIAFFRANPLPGILCNDLSEDLLTFIPEEANEHHGLFQFPAKINNLVGKQKKRPPLRFFLFKNVDVLMENRIFSVMKGNDRFDPISGRVPCSSDLDRPADGHIPSAIITMDRYGLSNISHHLFDVLGRHIAMTLSASETAVFPNAPILVPATNGAYQNHVMTQLDIPHEVMPPSGKTHIDTLLICSQVTVDEQEGFAHPAHMAHRATLQEMRRRINVNAPVQSRQKLYVSRRDSDRRQMVNEAELEDRLSSHGFQVIVPSTMTPDQQLRALSEAKVVVAPHGAGLTNLIACQSGTMVHELFHPMKGTDAYAGVSHALDLPYSFSVLTDKGGDHKGHLDIEALCDQLSDTGML